MAVYIISYRNSTTAAAGHGQAIFSVALDSTNQSEWRTNMCTGAVESKELVEFGDVDENQVSGLCDRLTSCSTAKSPARLLTQDFRVSHQTPAHLSHLTCSVCKTEVYLREPERTGTELWAK